MTKTYFHLLQSSTGLYSFFTSDAICYENKKTLSCKIIITGTRL